MSERFAVDTNAVVDLLRHDRLSPPLLQKQNDVWLPLPVAGELFAGVYTSQRVVQNLGELEVLIGEWALFSADLETARIYGRLRGEVHLPVSTSRMNDLWIAAICLQYDLPLLTNDSGFKSVPGLTVITW